MTLRPTEKAQEAWINKRLNGGVLPEDEKEYWNANSYYDTACYDALAWLESAQPDITTLAQAWNRCPRPDWLLWCLMWMKPNRKDVSQALKAMKVIFQALKQSKRDRELLDIHEDSDYSLESVQHELEFIEKRFKQRDATPKRMMAHLAQAAVDIFETGSDMPGAEKVFKKHCKIFRRHYPNPWVMK